MNALRALSKLTREYQAAVAKDPRIPTFRPPKQIRARLQKITDRVASLVKYSPAHLDNQTDWVDLARTITQLEVLLNRHKPRNGSDPGFSADFLYKIDSIIDDLALLMSNSVHRVKPHELNVSLMAIVNIYLRLISGPEIGPIHLKDAIKQTLLQNSFAEQEKNQILDALHLLSKLGFDRERARYIRQLIHPNVNQDWIRGIIIELMALLHINRNPDLEICDLNLNIGKNGSGINIEFFDVIARSKSSNRLILFEVKGVREYSLIEFMEQFLGLVIQSNGFSRKTVSQLDVLLYPERFSHLKSRGYRPDLNQGNIEIRILTPNVLPRLEIAGVYAKIQTLGQLLAALPETATSSSSPHALFHPSSKAISEAVGSRLKEIQGQRRALLGVRIRFETMKPQERAIFRGSPQFVG
jgi:hypothetical protein